MAAWQAFWSLPDSVCYSSCLSFGETPQTRWTAPPPGFIKFNTDASFDSVSGSASMAVLMRDSRGLLIDGYCFSRLAFFAFVAEATAMLAVVTIAKYRGITHAYFETDALLLLNALAAHNDHCPWEAQAIIHDINALVSPADQFVFFFM